MPIVQMRTRALGRWSDLLLVTARKRQSWHGNLGLSGFKDHHWGPPPLRLISKPASGVHFRKPRCPGGWREQMSFMALGVQSVRPQGSELGRCAWTMCCEFKGALVGMCTCKTEKGIDSGGSVVVGKRSKEDLWARVGNHPRGHLGPSALPF